MCTPLSRFHLACVSNGKCTLGILTLPWPDILLEDTSDNVYGVQVKVPTNLPVLRWLIVFRVPKETTYLKAALQQYDRTIQRTTRNNDLLRLDDHFPHYPS